MYVASLRREEQMRGFFRFAQNDNERESFWLEMTKVVRCLYRYKHLLRRC